MAIRASESDFNADALFDKLLSRLHKGDVLVTVATGEMNEAEADRSGLVPTHAYAVLDVRKIKVPLWLYLNLITAQGLSVPMIVAYWFTFL